MDHSAAQRFLKGPLHPAARRSCDLAQVSAIRDKLVTLSDLRRGLVQSERDFLAATSHMGLLNATLLGLQWTVAFCDGFIAIAGALTGPKGKAIALSYSLAKGTAVVAASGGSDGTYDLAATVVVDVVMQRNAVAKQVAPMFKVYSDVAHFALQRDSEALLKAAFIDQHFAIASMAANATKNAPVADLLDAAKAVVDTGFAMHRAYRDFKQAQSGSAASRKAVQTTLRNSMATIERQMRQLERDIEGCDVDPALMSRPPA